MRGVGGHGTIPGRAFLRCGFGTTPVFVDRETIGGDFGEQPVGKALEVGAQAGFIALRPALIPVEPVLSVLSRLARRSLCLQLCRAAVSLRRQPGQKIARQIAGGGQPEAALPPGNRGAAGGSEQAVNAVRVKAQQGQLPLDGTALITVEAQGIFGHLRADLRIIAQTLQRRAGQGGKATCGVFGEIGLVA